jgi:hypothetical protein
MKSYYMYCLNCLLCLYYPNVHYFAVSKTLGAKTALFGCANIDHSGPQNGPRATRTQSNYHQPLFSSCPNSYPQNVISFSCRVFALRWVLKVWVVYIRSMSMGNEWRWVECWLCCFCFAGIKAYDIFSNVQSTEYILEKWVCLCV